MQLLASNVLLLLVFSATFSVYCINPIGIIPARVGEVVAGVCSSPISVGDETTFLIPLMLREGPWLVKWTLPTEARLA